MWRKTRHLPGPVNHGIQRVTYDYDNGIWGSLADLLGHSCHNSNIRNQKILTAHSRLSGKTGGNHDDVTPRRFVVPSCPYDLGIKADYGGCLKQIQRFALRHPFKLGDIDKDNISKVRSCTPKGSSGPNISRSDNGNLRSTIYHHASLTHS
jgi:hypothetical protein